MNPGIVMGIFFGIIGLFLVIAFFAGVLPAILKNRKFKKRNDYTKKLFPNHDYTLSKISIEFKPTPLERIKRLSPNQQLVMMEIDKITQFDAPDLAKVTFKPNGNEVEHYEGLLKQTICNSTGLPFFGDKIPERVKKNKRLYDVMVKRMKEFPQDHGKEPVPECIRELFRKGILTVEQYARALKTLKYQKKVAPKMKTFTCLHCDAQIEPKANFCDNCGNENT